jgi:CD109 antigen
MMEEVNIHFTTFRWLATDEAKTSGPTTLEVETPSGYGFVQSDANELVIKNNYTFIRDVFIGRSKIIWVFDRVNSFRIF